MGRHIDRPATRQLQVNFENHIVSWEKRLYREAEPALRRCSMAASNSKFNVGGVLLNQPFKIRRLGHFGFNLSNMEDGVHFYIDLLGFRISDVMDYSRRAKDPAQVAGLGDPNGYFTRYGTDHHAMVLFPKRVRDALGRSEQPGHHRQSDHLASRQPGRGRQRHQMVQRARYQAATLRPRHAGIELAHLSLRSRRSEQRALLRHRADRLERPQQTAQPCTIAASINRLSCRRFRNSRKSQQARAKGIDIFSGYRHVEKLPAQYDVDGVLLPRPFQDRPPRAGLSVHREYRCGRNILSRHAGVHSDRRSYLARRALFVFPLQY